MLTVREIHVEEVDLCRSLRLRALSDAPEAFGERYDDAVRLDSAYWTKLIQSLTPPSRQRMFLAYVNETCCGSVFAILDRDHTDMGRVGGMWVDSKFRRQGVATQLLGAVFEWAKENDFGELRLWCEAGDNGAHTFYKTCGFNDSEKWNTMRDKVDKDLVEMVWRVV